MPDLTPFVLQFPWNTLPYDLGGLRFLPCNVWPLLGPSGGNNGPLARIGCHRALSLEPNLSEEGVKALSCIWGIMER